MIFHDNNTHVIMLVQTTKHTGGAGETALGLWLENCLKRDKEVINSSGGANWLAY